MKENKSFCRQRIIVNRVSARFFLFPLALLLFSGCVYLTHFEEVMFMKGLSDSGKEIERYSTAQETSFGRLKEDILNDRLKKGLLKTRIIDLYGDPIFCKESKTAAAECKEVCLFRHPTKYFNTDRVFLYFDQNKKLAFFELKRAQE